VEGKVQPDEVANADQVALAAFVPRRLIWWMPYQGQDFKPDEDEGPADDGKVRINRRQPLTQA